MFKKKSLFEQLKEISPEFAESVVKLDNASLKNKLADLSIADSEIDEAMKEDQDLQKAKTAYDVAKEGYADITAANKLKRKYLIRLLKDRSQAS